MLVADQPNHSAIPPQTPAIFRSVDFVNCISSSRHGRGRFGEVKPNRDPEDQRVHNNTQKGQIVHQATAMLRSTTECFGPEKLSDAGLCQFTKDNVLHAVIFSRFGLSKVQVWAGSSGRVVAAG